MRQLLPPQYWGPGGLLFLSLFLLLTPAQARKDHSGVAPIPAKQVQAFALGFALQSAAARTRMFLDDVKGLRDIRDEDEGAAEVAKLAAQSQTLRRREANCYAEAVQQLQALGAPPDLQTWARGAADQLAAPLKLSKEAQKEQKSDPNTATVLGTIDEAQAIKAATDGKMPRLRVWVKLFYGTSGTWAGAVGSLAAEMNAAVANDRRLPMTAGDAAKLAQEAPAGTPPSVIQALDGLTPKSGNLAVAVHAAPVPLTPQELKSPLQTLLEAFNTRELTKTLDKH